MTEPPVRVSIVIPCYNGGADLPGAIDSLKEQTFPDLEVIVVDDGSTDPLTRRVLKMLPAGVRLVRHPKNRGLPAARNTGFKLAKGPVVLPLDCDDRLEPTFLEKTVAALDDHPESDFVFTYLRLIGDKEGTLAKSYNPFAQLFLNQLPYCLLIRKRTWEKVGGYDETMRTGYEDWEFNVRLSANGYLGTVVPEPLFVYRVSARGMLQSLSSRHHGELWKTIRNRHPDQYRLERLYGIYTLWKDKPLPYPVWALLGLLIANVLLPAPLFNRVFAFLQRYSASSRAAARST